MRIERLFNASWIFREGFIPDQVSNRISGQVVDLPHTAVEFPVSYGDESSYQKEFTYQKYIEWEEQFAGREVFLLFEGAMANSVVYINGNLICAHSDGYTPFKVRMTDYLSDGKNLITVKVDGSENPDIPPFGGRIDYLTYAGIYRDVSLVVTSPISISNTKIETHKILEDVKSLTATVWLDNPSSLPIQGMLKATLLSSNGSVVADCSVPASTDRISLSMDELNGIELWGIDHPTLYTLKLELITGHHADAVDVRFGFRTAEFSADGFRLNGELIKLLGLNRHQSYPHVGYALGRYAQERDAELVKYDLSCNVVRTSHYPQSAWFLDHCDRIGLLVLTEIPGWQHIGDENWKQKSIENVQALVERDWNHPSIITWGVRINESEDDHEFYTATNAKARQLDSSRQTSGIRKHPNSELLEDIYTMNDFVQGSEEVIGGNSIVLRDQQEQTGLNTLVPYMITEYNGHMYPTKVFDQEQRQAEHVTRHLNIINRTFGDPQIAGCIGWCMSDYNTHKDFGSGDRVCHHGVTTMYRFPKFAAYAYASQGDPISNPVMQPVTFYARGERNIGGILPLIVLTNLDEIEFVFSNGNTKRFKPRVDRYPNLPHAPIIVERDDVAGDEFGKWGMQWEDLTLVGYLDGKIAKSLTLLAAPLPTRLDVVADKTEMNIEVRDEVRVAVRALDQADNILPFLFDDIHISISGPATLIGPANVPLLGGTTGFWIRGGCEPAEVRVEVSSSRFSTVEVVLRTVE